MNKYILDSKKISLEDVQSIKEQDKQSPYNLKSLTCAKTKLNVDHTQYIPFLSKQNDYTFGNWNIY